MSVRFLSMLLYFESDVICPRLILAQHGDAAKGAKYIAQLYEARSNGQWEEVPELSRKVEKHVPARRSKAIN